MYLWLSGKWLSSRGSGGMLRWEGERRAHLGMNKLCNVKEQPVKRRSQCCMRSLAEAVPASVPGWGRHCESSSRQCDVGPLLLPAVCTRTSPSFANKCTGLLNSSSRGSGSVPRVLCRKAVWARGEC